ncbi:MAG: AsmA family protein [Motiliproteus sp.]
MKLIVKIVAVSVVVVIVVLGALLVLVDPNDFKAELQQLAREHGQVELQLHGDIGWSLYPSIALSLPKLDVSRLDGEPLAALQRAEVSVRVLPLLSGDLQMKGLLLDGLDVDWTAAAMPSDTADQPLDEPASGSKTPGTQSGPDSGMKGDSTAPRFDIGHVEVINARLRYTDPATAQTIELRDLNFRADQLVSGQPFPATLSVELAVLEGNPLMPVLTVQTELQTQLLVDLEQDRFEATGVSLQLLLSGALLPDPSQPLALELTTDLLVDRSQDRAEISSLKLVLAELVLEADLKVAALSVQPQLNGQLHLLPFDLKKLLLSLGLLVPETQDDSVLRQLELQAVLTGTANELALQPVQLTLDQSQLSGNLAYQFESGAQTIELVLDGIDVDRYLSPTQTADTAAVSKGATATPAKADGRYSKAPLLPIELLQSLNLDADLSVTDLKVSGLSLQQLKLLLSAHGGLVNVTQLSGQLYQGDFHNTLVLDARRQPLQLTVSKRLNQVELGGMLQDLSGVDQFSGRLSMQGQYRAEGNSVYAMVHSLDGNMDLGLKEGQLKGVDLGDTLCRGILRLKGQPMPAATAQTYTDFSNLSATATINNGVVVNNDLKAALTGIDLTGSGQVNLPAEGLNYSIDLSILQGFNSANCRIDQRLHNLALPLRCRGGFDDDPAGLCGVDSQRIQKVIAEAGGREAKQKLEKKLEEKLGEQLKDNESVKGLLKGLF